MKPNQTQPTYMKYQKLSSKGFIFLKEYLSPKRGRKKHKYIKNI